MNSFFQDLKEWQAFFSTVALASATLVGLLFVSLSLHREKGSSSGLSARISTAQRSFGDFLYVLMLGLVFLVPHQAPVGLAVALFVLGLARAVGLIRQATKRSHRRNRASSFAGLVREYALPSFASLGLLVVAVEVLRGDTIAIYGLVLVIAALLSTGSWNAWILLIEH
jgi:ABC-type dipeptide/oligopeptide/nickel transport system permease component